jgi:hypothetical protein
VLLDCPADVEDVALPHRCPNASADAPIAYRVGPGGRVRLAEGETLPVTARCHRCGGRAFVSLVDPAARERRLAQVRPDPAALRAPSRPGGPSRWPGRSPDAHAERVRRFAGPSPTRPAGPSRPRATEDEPDPCPACGQVPDSFGHCRCSA